MRDAVARQGWPMGTLCAELEKDEGGLDHAARVMGIIVDWSEEQFRQLASRTHIARNDAGSSGRHERGDAVDLGLRHLRRPLEEGVVVGRVHAGAGVAELVA
jgi:hypothetical protein